jgi:hypothetical protein
LFNSKNTFRSFVSPICVLLCSATAFASTITGTVTNGTTGKPSSGDTIAVINTSQSMDEISKVTSDATGNFHVSAPDGGQILLHVTHRGAEYFKSVTANTGNLAIEVYDSATKIAGITGEAAVLRMETDATGKTLNVSENFFVQNAATPPRTEVGGNTFDFYLPKDAQVTQSLASTPGGLPTSSKVALIDAANGHYAFTFPIRPGETRFQVSYTLPYSGKQPFSLKLSVPTGDVAVMLPKTMQFEGSAQFQPINPDPNSNSFDAHDPGMAQPIQFAVTGVGQLPNEAQGALAQGGANQSGNGPQVSQPASGTRPGGGLGAPEDPEGTNDPWAKYKWWIIGALGLALAGGAGVLLKSRPVIAGAAPVQAGDIASTGGSYVAATVAAPSLVSVSGANPLLQGLRDELFELETDRLSGKLSETQYAEYKAAFDVVLRRALSRVEPL